MYTTKNEASTIHWTGISGKSYGFKMFPIDQKFNHFGGIYVFAKSYFDGNTRKYAALYFGISEDVGSRLNHHEKKQCALNNGGNTVGVIVEENEIERDKAETDLLQNYNTTCNDQQS